MCVVEFDEMDIYSFGDEAFDDISDDEDMDSFSVGYIKECEKAKHIKEEEPTDED
jgi:hypothetical protein